MKPFVIEPERSTPVWAEYEVIVVGGGIAGVAAAVAAARQGVRVCLVEKESAPGGLATLGNVVMYLFLCDGTGRQVIGGLGEELLRLACREGAASLPDCWQPGGNQQERCRTRYMVTFVPAAYLLALEAFLIDNGVDLWYDTRFCTAIREEGRIRALCVENKSGRGALLCRTVVDASGDADVCHQAGEETVSCRTNVACGWIHTFDGSALTLHPLTRPFAADPEAPGEESFAGDRGSGVTAQILASRRLIREHLEALRRQFPASSLTPVYVPAIATVRMTRRLKGRQELRAEDAGRRFVDTIGLTGDWRRAGPVYALPLSSLMAVRTENLLAAGRCISAAGECWDITRVIAPCSVTGEAAGTAAAVAARETDGCPDRLNIHHLQAALRDKGVLLEPDEAGG